MCGMSGIMSTSMIDNEIELARRLLILNMFRGEDSTGMFDYMPKEKDTNQINYWKTTDHPVDFVKNTFGLQKTERWKTNKPQLIATHCRAATQGKLTDKNAHPFCFKTLIGMHNGTISKDFANRKKFGTDSEALFYNIEHAGLADALKEIRSLDPAFALVWLNWKEGTLNFIRNGRRPLSYVYMYVNKTIAWSSEGEHIKLASTTSSGYQSIKETIAFKPYIHYSIKLDANSYEFTEIEIPEAKEKVETVYYSNAGFPNWNMYGRDEGEYSAWDPTTNTYRSNTSSTSASVEDPTYWEAFGRDTGETSYAHTCFDNITKKWFAPYAFGELEKTRKAKALKAEQEATTTNVATFPAKQEGKKETSTNTPSTAAEAAQVFISDNLPWEDEEAKEDLSKFFDLSVSSEIGKDYRVDSNGEIIELKFQFGPGLRKNCSEAAYLAKTAAGCACCGMGCELEDTVFWLNDHEHVCANCAEDLAMHTENHWLITHAGVSLETCNRIAEEYLVATYTEESAEPQHIRSVH